MDICYVASDFTMLWIKVSRMGLLDVSAYDDDGLYYRNYSIDSKIKKRIVEDYGKGGFDPLGDKYPHKIEHCTYYDENGNVISNR